MSVLINKDTKVICQGFTGGQVLSTLNKLSITVRKWSVVYLQVKAAAST